MATRMGTTTTDSKTLTELVAELEESERIYEGAKRTESEARRNAGASLTRLNEAQEAIDKYLASRKADSPYDSKWKNSTVAKVEVPR